VCESAVVVNIQELEGELCLTPSRLFQIFTDDLHRTGGVSSDCACARARATGTPARGENVLDLQYVQFRLASH